MPEVRSREQNELSHMHKQGEAKSQSSPTCLHAEIMHNSARLTAAQDFENVGNSMSGFQRQGNLIPDLSWTLQGSEQTPFSYMWYFINDAMPRADEVNCNLCQERAIS